MSPATEGQSRNLADLVQSIHVLSLQPDDILLIRLHDSAMPEEAPIFKQAWEEAWAELSDSEPRVIVTVGGEEIQIVRPIQSNNEVSP